jgi:large subunit ribosomal protein L13
MQTTYVPKKNEVASRWFVVDAADMVLGRLCTAVAFSLMGKTRPQYSPSLDVGDHVVVLNAAKIRVTGRKLEQKTYIRHTGYPGGLKIDKIADVKAKHPDRIILEGVKGMLPKTKLGKAMLSKLRVYAGTEHPHQAQQPVPLVVGGSKKPKTSVKKPAGEAR